jgi:hypothetical protein
MAFKICSFTPEGALVCGGALGRQPKSTAALHNTTIMSLGSLL